MRQAEGSCERLVPVNPPDPIAYRMMRERDVHRPVALLRVEEVAGTGDDAHVDVPAITSPVYALECCAQHDDVECAFLSRVDKEPRCGLLVDRLGNRWPILRIDEVI